MGQITKVIMKMARDLDWESYLFLMVHPLRVNSKMIVLTAMVFIYEQMEGNMKALG